MHDHRGLPPPPNSYANEGDADLALYYIEIYPGGKFLLPAAKGKLTKRKIYLVEGQSVSIGSESLKGNSAATLDASQDVEFSNNSNITSEVLLLQGKPIGTYSISSLIIQFNNRRTCCSTWSFRNEYTI